MDNVYHGHVLRMTDIIKQNTILQLKPNNKLEAMNPKLEMSLNHVWDVMDLQDVLFVMAQGCKLIGLVRDKKFKLVEDVVVPGNVKLATEAEWYILLHITKQNISLINSN